jgi:DNA-binding FrmR family transcriptional regulator
MKKYPSHNEHLSALRRIEGQIRGIQKMIEDRKYCVDIITQIEAARGALASVGEKVLGSHFRHCVTDALRGKSPTEKDKKIEEVLKLIRKMHGV